MHIQGVAKLLTIEDSGFDSNTMKLSWKTFLDIVIGLDTRQPWIGNLGLCDFLRIVAIGNQAVSRSVRAVIHDLFIAPGGEAESLCSWKVPVI